MPLGDRQENDLVHITLDVWQDQVFLNEKAYPAGRCCSSAWRRF